MIKSCAIGFAAAVWPVVLAGAAEPVTLRETAPVDSTTRVVVELKAQGLYKPAALTPGGAATKGEESKSLALKVEARLDFVERLLKVNDEGRPLRVVRRVVRAGSAINGEVRPQSAAVRPDVAILVAEVKGTGARKDVVVFSPLGPLTRPELELVQGPGDPLALPGLLPPGPVSTGDHWKVEDATVRSLSAYDTLESSTLEATLESAGAETAQVRLRGEVRGSVLGGEGSMACEGWYTVDRKAGRVDRLTLRRAETRRPGPVEEGLDVKSTLTVTRRPVESPPELADQALAKLALEPGPESERLVLIANDGRYSVDHDRNWHLFWDDPRVIVLKRVVGGRLIAQCNLANGPNAGKGRHQDVSQFRDDVRKGLGPRFARFLGAGEVGGDPAGGFRYKVGVQGRQGDLGVIWYYYLIAGPVGEQVLATFTLAETEQHDFGNGDEVLIGSFRWKEGGEGAVATPAPSSRR